MIEYSNVIVVESMLFELKAVRIQINIVCNYSYASL